MRPITENLYQKSCKFDMITLMIPTTLTTGKPNACRECLWLTEAALMCMDCHLSNLPNVVASCVVLHNV